MSSLHGRDTLGSVAHRDAMKPLLAKRQKLKIRIAVTVVAVSLIAVLYGVLVKMSFNFLDTMSAIHWAAVAEGQMKLQAQAERER